MRESNHVSRKVASLASLSNPIKRGSIMKPLHNSVGRVFSSSNCGDFTVEEYVNSANVTVRFLDTGGLKKTKYCHVLSGGVRDDMMPVHYGVGFIGSGIHRSKVAGKKTTCYLKWAAMLQRCYSGRSPTYADCFVCDEWHNFQNFADWFYENYPKDGHDYHLDKDIKVNGNKVYSPDACMFVTAVENIVASSAMSWRIKSPSGEVYDVYNMADFCREHGLCSGNVSSMLSGKYKSSKGWTRAN